MKTDILPSLAQTPKGREAEAILKACVHCGFCNATCPTYGLLGDELDGPRGRIYLIKDMLEGQAVGKESRKHLDRCLTCLACETTCPSGVAYGRLLDIGRALLEISHPRPFPGRLVRFLLRKTVPYPRRFRPLARIGRLFSRHAPPCTQGTPWPPPRHERQVIVFKGCVQRACAPHIDASLANLLDRLGINPVAVPGEGCCGALSYHLGSQGEGLDFARRNIDAWWPHVGEIEAIVSSSSACGLMIKDYGHLLKEDPMYREKAEVISGLARDPVEVLEKEAIEDLRPKDPHAIAFHSPCTLQHGQRLSGRAEDLLKRLGFRLTPLPDAHLCCGAAGAYAILQPAISKALRKAKIEALEGGRPEAIATANIGCLWHLQQGTALPVHHWLTLVDAFSPPG